jgi:hypothetical protein
MGVDQQAQQHHGEKFVGEGGTERSLPGYRVRARLPEAEA